MRSRGGGGVVDIKGGRVRMTINGTRAPWCGGGGAVVVWWSRLDYLTVVWLPWWCALPVAMVVTNATVLLFWLSAVGARKGNDR